MKNVFLTILLFGAIACGLFTACTGGAYNASPSSNANYVVNPLEPLKSSQFTWGVGATPAYHSGKGVMGGVINGVDWSASNVSYGFSLGISSLIGSTGSQTMSLSMLNVYAANLYSMGYKQYNQTCTWADSVGSSYDVYQSIYGNSGEVYITENDSAYLSGMFYCECITSSGLITAINNGYFSFAKP